MYIVEAIETIDNREMHLFLSGRTGSATRLSAAIERRRQKPTSQDGRHG